MGDRHNKSRYGELWPQYRIDRCLEELNVVKDYVVLSGGWAWHFISPQNHKEYKHAHDHKDIDVFVKPENVGAVVSLLKERSFEKVWTRYDKSPSDEDFRRYEKNVTDEKEFKITIDFFVGDVPTRVVNGWNLTEPEFLLSLYSSIHSSDKCFAVKAAMKLIEANIDPVGRKELVEIPEN